MLGNIKYGLILYFSCVISTVIIALLTKIKRKFSFRYEGQINIELTSFNEKRIIDFEQNRTRYSDENDYVDAQYSLIYQLLSEGTTQTLVETMMYKAIISSEEYKVIVFHSLLVRLRHPQLSLYFLYTIINSESKAVLILSVKYQSNKTLLIIKHLTL